VDDLNRRVNAALAHRFELGMTGMRGLESRLMALNPMAVLQRGYAVVTKNQQVVSSRVQVQEGDALRVRLHDGEFDARVSGDG